MVAYPLSMTRAATSSILTEWYQHQSSKKIVANGLTIGNSDACLPSIVTYCGVESMSNGRYRGEGIVSNRVQ